MNDDELLKGYAGYSNQDLADFIVSGVPESQEADFKRLLILRKLASYEHYRESELGDIDPATLATIPPPIGGKKKNQGTIINKPKNRVIYIILGLFLGAFGVHNFYIGYNIRGCFQLLLTIAAYFTLGLTLLISILWALIEIFTVRNDANKVVLR